MIDVIHEMYFVILEKTSGKPGFAHPEPKEVIPARYQRPSLGKRELNISMI